MTKKYITITADEDFQMPPLLSDKDTAIKRARNNAEHYKTDVFVFEVVGVVTAPTQKDIPVL